MTDSVNHGASVVQESGVVVSQLGLTRGPSVVDNWTGNNATFRLLAESGSILDTEAGDRLRTETP